MNLFEIVRGSPLGAEMTEEECRVLAESVESRKLGDGETLISEGSSDDRLYVVLAGALAVAKDTGGGDWVALHMLRAGDLAGELGFLDGTSHSATLRAVGETEVMSLQRAKLEGLLGEHPRLVYRVMRSIIREVHGILRRMNYQYVELSNYISKQHGRY